MLWQKDNVQLLIMNSILIIIKRNMHHKKCKNTQINMCKYIECLFPVFNMHIVYTFSTLYIFSLKIFIKI